MPLLPAKPKANAVAVAAPASAIADGASEIPTPTIDETANAIAALSIPIIPGVANLLRAKVCIKQPAKLNAAPVYTPASNRGKRKS